MWFDKSNQVVLVVLEFLSFIQLDLHHFCVKQVYVLLCLKTEDKKITMYLTNLPYWTLTLS